MMIWDTTIGINKWKNHISHLDKPPKLIQQLLSANQLLMIAGETGKGKTNELLHLMFCFTYGGKWHGLEVTPKPSLYIAFEGKPEEIDRRKDKIESQYQYLGMKELAYIRLSTRKIPLDLTRGQEEIVRIIGELTPRPEVIFLDPFKRTISSNYFKGDIADRWIQGASKLARELNCAVIAAHHTTKVIYPATQPPDYLSGDRVKGASDLLDGVDSAILIAEEKANRRIKEAGESRVVWTILGIAMKVIKARDSTSDFPLLRLTFNREKLKLDGQEWVVGSDGRIGIALEEAIRHGCFRLSQL